MAVDPEVEHAKCTGVDDAKPIGFTGLEGQSRIFIETNTFMIIISKRAWFMIA